ncbi:MAG TPA: hypothetical protein PLO73_13785 [Spirochaetota bacterium]|nr:hypothetical protein [Spirochaetota bacterium]
MIVDKTSSDAYFKTMEEMKKTKIKSYWDLLSVLKEHPDWLEELRKLILTEELLALPKKFDEFVKRYESFIENEFKPLKATVEKQGNDVGSLKGDNFERKVKEKAPSYFGKLILKCRLIDSMELANSIDDAILNKKATITDDERDDALKVDVVVTGFLRHNKEKKVFLAAEVSIVVDKTDVERAARRTKIIEKCLGIPGIPVVIGDEYTDGAKKAAEELQVIMI